MVGITGRLTRRISLNGKWPMIAERTSPFLSYHGIALHVRSSTNCMFDLQTPGLSPKSRSPSLQLNRRWTRAALVPLCCPVSAAKTRRLTSVSGTIPIKARPTCLILDSRDVPSPMTAFQTRDTATMSTTIETMPGASAIAQTSQIS